MLFEEFTLPDEIFIYCSSPIIEKYIIDSILNINKNSKIIKLDSKKQINELFDENLFKMIIYYDFKYNDFTQQTKARIICLGRGFDKIYELEELQQDYRKYKISKLI